MEKAIGGGLYANKQGEFWIRPTVHGNRTWHKLKAINRKEAQAEAVAFEDEVEQEKAKGEEMDIHEVTASFLAAYCPNSRLEKRGNFQIAVHARRLSTIAMHMGEIEIRSLKISDCVEYCAWRKQQAKHGTGERSAEMDLQCLSNALNWAVSMGYIESNPIRTRPRFVKSSEVRHCRDCAPESIDQVHAAAGVLFQDKRSAVLGWQLLFEALTGCRTSEILEMRLDAKPQESGWYNEKALFVRRSKSGINPWIPMTQPLWELIGQFTVWRLSYGGDYLFPGNGGIGHVTKGALTKRLTTVCEQLGFKKWTSHGMRSFYVTVRRSQGASDAQIAGEIGDKTVSLISSTYGDRPPNWVGGEVLSFTPETPAWNTLNKQ